MAKTRLEFKKRDLNRVLKKLQRLPEGMTTDVLGEVLQDAAKPITEAAISKAPRDRPKLANDIKAEQTPGKAEVAIGAGRRSPHASLLEFGTRYIPAQPFLKPAFLQQKDAALGIIKRELAALVRKEAQR